MEVGNQSYVFFFHSFSLFVVLYLPTSLDLKICDFVLFILFLSLCRLRPISYVLCFMFYVYVYVYIYLI